MRKLLSKLFTIAVVVTLAGCVVAIPNGITPPRANRAGVRPVAKRLLVDTDIASEVRRRLPGSPIRVALTCPKAALAKSVITYTSSDESEFTDRAPAPSSPVRDFA